MLKGTAPTWRPARSNETAPPAEAKRTVTPLPEITLKPPSRLSSKQAAVYGQFKAAARTQQETHVVDILERQHRALGRPPTFSEVLRGHNESGSTKVKRDRLAQIIRNLNRRSPDERKLRLTEDRDYKVFQKPAKELFKQFLKLHDAPPTRSEFTKILRANKIFISATTQDFILKRIRNAEPKASRSVWRLSRRRLGVTWLHITDAYEEAEILLKQQGVKRKPAAEEVSFFLKKANAPLSPRALEFRMSRKPASVAISLSPYSDPAPSIIRTCYKQLRAKLDRNPNLKELREAFNALSLRPTNLDALWTRVARMNSQQSRNKITLNPILPSGIYDCDIVKAHGELVVSLKRNPTIRELRSGIAERHGGKTLAEDSLCDRLETVRLPLTSENTLKAEKQREITFSIKSLRLLFRRRPLRAEVMSDLQERGVAITEGEFNTTLGTLKKRLSLAERAKLHLGMPNHLASKVVQEFSRLSVQDPYPPFEKLRTSLKWSDAGLTGVIPLAQTHAAKRRYPPVTLAGTELGDTLKAIEAVLDSSLRVHRGERAPKVSPEDVARLGELPRLLAGWDVPALPLPDVVRQEAYQRIAPAELVLPFQISWICLVALHAPPREVPETLETDARRLEEDWARRHAPRAPGNKTKGTQPPNPFAGMALTLLAAKQAGRFDRAQGPALAAHANFRDKVRNEIRLLALQCGFPASLVPESSS